MLLRKNNGAQKPPTQVKDGDHYKKLETLVESVCSMYTAQDPAATRTVLFSCRANQTTASEIEGGSFRSDAAIFHLAISSVPRYNCGGKDMFSADVVLNAEFKLEDNLQVVKQNRMQMVGGAAHYMNNDPRRCHMFSMSIERDNVRIWFYSRSHSAKSASFSLCKDIEPLAYLIVALSFATEEDLGYDTMITHHREQESNKIYYIYKVEDIEYKTVKCISEYYATAIPGRATRVWLVETILGKRRSVLKDYWLEEGATEKEIQEQIYSNLESVKKRVNEGDLEAFAGIPEAEKVEMRRALGHYHKYFVNIVSCTKIGVSKAPPSSYIRCRVLETEPSAPSVPPTVLSSTDRSILSGDPKQVPTFAEPHQARAFRNKQHCRLIYKEECTPFYAIKDLKSAMIVLYDSVIGLQLLYLAGFVHRDVSAGNVMCYDMGSEKAVGKLGDLEYARPFPQVGEIFVDPKIGTPGFISVEVGLEQYLYTRPLYLPGKIAPDPPFQFNFLHDIDSVFWLALWLFTTSSPDTIVPEDHHRSMIFTLFSFMVNDRRQATVTKSLDPIKFLVDLTFTRTLPLLFSSIEQIHQHLIEFYEKVEEKRIFTDPTHYEGVHGSFKAQFRNIINTLPASSIPLNRIYVVHSDNPGAAAEALVGPPEFQSARLEQLRLPTVQVSHHRRPRESAGEDMHQGKRRKVEKDDV